MQDDFDDDGWDCRTMIWLVRSFRISKGAMPSSTWISKAPDR